MANNVTADFDIRLEGPIFTGAIYGQMKKVIHDIEEETADEVVEMVQARDDDTFKNPTGHARSKVQKERDGSVMTIDRYVIYARWLEGVSERNSSSRFKGYKTFERVSREYQPKVAEVCARVIAEYLIK